MSSAVPLLTLTADGLLRTAPVREGDADPRLEALLHQRALLGDGPDEQIPTRLPLPAALGLERADHLLPASLALLEGIGADLTSFGWRLGVGVGGAFHRALDLRDETLDAARIAYLGYDGTMQLTVLGPLTLAASTWTAAGERALTDSGLLRELPAMLAAGLVSQLARVQERLPQAAFHLLVLEPAADAVLEGRLRPASGRGTIAPIPAPELGPRWRDLLEEMGAMLPAERITLAPGSRPALLQMAWQAGARRLAVSPRRLGDLSAGASREAWEEIAGLRDRGAALEILLDPARADATGARLLRVTGELGLAPHELAGLTLVGTGLHGLVEQSAPGALEGPADPAREEALGTALESAQVDALRGFAQRLGELITR